MSKTDKAAGFMPPQILLEIEVYYEKYISVGLAKDSSLKYHLQTGLSEWEQWWSRLKIFSGQCPRGVLDITGQKGKA